MPAVALHPTVLRQHSDEELVAELRDGHEDAFTTLVERYEPTLLVYARNVLGGSHHDAEECVQDAFIRALTFLKSRPDRDITLKPWLYTITRNACLDRLRKPNRSVDLESVQGVLRDNGADPHGRAVAREQLSVVVGGLQALPERQRAALVMHELEGRSHESLGAQLGVSVAASKALVCRARAGMSHLREAA